jgi:arsenate reductase (glutaredoxin)
VSLPITVYHYPGCSTCRKARKWLVGQGTAHTLVHIVDAPPSAETLAGLIRRSGLPYKRFFNTSGQSYRGGGWKDRIGDLDIDSAAAALAADGKLIKRPLVDAGDTVLVGFKEATWAAALGAGGAA